MKLADNLSLSRRLPVGAETQPGGGVHFRVWAPRRERVEVVLEDGQSGGLVLEEEPLGYFSGLAKAAGAGSLYRFRLDGGEELYPDPASRFQPYGPFGPSQVVDPRSFQWTDQAWTGLKLKGQVLYEVHIGTFTKEGTWDAASIELPVLADLGITTLEVLPVAEFPGRFGWGYDGVDLFSPTHLYGRPEDMARFANAAHCAGIGVILDVVYNHLGPDGNYLPEFSDDYFTEKYHTDWGTPFNFDGINSDPVREFITANAGYWIDEYHLDGLRIDATQNIYDSSPDHIFTAIVSRVREAAGARSTLIIAENEPQDSDLVRPQEKGGYGMDMLWNDDFHHSAMVALTGHNEAYYTDYFGCPQEFISAAKWGYLYQGQRYRWQKKRRGRPALDIDPARFVTFIQNHDQIANSGRSLRVHQLTSPGKYRAMTALMLLGPNTPMLFQGQEFASSSPFFYFADQKKEISDLVHLGRKQFLRQFRSLATDGMQDLVPEPDDARLFEASKLDFSDREKHAGIYAMHRDLLRLRRDDPAFRAQARGMVDGSVIGPEALLLRYFCSHGDRLIIVNLGMDLGLDPAPEPLLAPPLDMTWNVMWASTDPRYGGCGTPELDTLDNWQIPGLSAFVLGPEKAPEEVMEWTI